MPDPRKVTFYHAPHSRSSGTLVLLEELHAAYELKLVNMKAGEQRQPAFLAINPMGKVPAIVHRGTVVTETAAICMYLADEFAYGTLAPKIGDPQRGTYLRWFFFGASCFDPAVVDKMLARPQPERTGAVGYGTFDDTINALAKALEPGPYILGERLSAVDVYVGAQIGHALMVKAIEPKPVFQKYADRVNSRPAMQRLLQGAK